MGRFNHIGAVTFFLCCSFNPVRYCFSSSPQFLNSYSSVGWFPLKFYTTAFCSSNLPHLHARFLSYLLRIQVTLFFRHGLHHRKKPAENVVLPNKTPPSFQLLSVALSETDSEIKEPMGYRSMANSLVGGNINCRKTRSLLFVKTEPKPDQTYQGKYQR